jgi:hypothetical protein
MSLEVYPSDFSTRYEITHAISIQMSLLYNDMGKVQIVVAANDYNIKALKKDYILYDTVHDATYIIVNVKCDTVENRITANGFTSEWRLNKRVVAAPQQIKIIETGVYGIVNDNLRGLTKISTAAVKGLTEKFQPDDPETQDEDESVIYGKGILDAITPVLEYGGLGRRMNWDPSTLSWEFEIFKGNDLTSGIHAITFAEEQGTCTNLVINEDASTFKNVAYVTWKKRDNTEMLATVGSATGDDRFELWLSSSVTQEDNETVAAARKRAESYAQLELGKHINRQSFSVVVDASELGVLYNIGDIVACSSVRFGVRFNARITGVTYTMDVSGEQTAVQLGDPILTALGEMKLNGNN